MPQYRRFYIPGGVYFFTVVTFERKPIFADHAACELLHRIWMKTNERRPFITEAFSLLPDE
jgi:putative transposase